MSENNKPLSSQESVNDPVKSICDIMRRGNVSSAVQHVPELTWILFLRVLDEDWRLLQEPCEQRGVSAEKVLKLLDVVRDYELKDRRTGIYDALKDIPKARFDDASPVRQ